MRKKVEIDIALHALCMHAMPGQTLTIRQIAEVCGCNRNIIYTIEKRALQKMANIQMLKQYMTDVGV